MSDHRPFVLPLSPDDAWEVSYWLGDGGPHAALLTFAGVKVQRGGVVFPTAWPSAGAATALIDLASAKAREPADVRLTAVRWRIAARAVSVFCDRDVPNVDCLPQPGEARRWLNSRFKAAA